MPARAFATVKSSSNAPSCMINAISPAAKCSPMQIDATSARETRTPALMSNAVTSPMMASKIIGTPHKIIATHAIENGSGM